MTIGIGISLPHASSLDLVYHHYRLAEPARILRNARLEATLTGEHRDVGQEVDFVLAVEEWERVEFELRAGSFEARRAFGEREGKWSYECLLAMRIAS